MVRTVRCDNYQDKQFLHRKLRQRPHFLINHTGCLRLNSTRNFIHNCNNNKDSLAKYLTDLLSFLWNAMVSKEVMELHCNLVSVTECTVRYLLNFETYSSVWFGCGWRIFFALLVISSHVTENKVNLLNI